MSNTIFLKSECINSIDIFICCIVIPSHSNVLHKLRILWEIQQEKILYGNRKVHDPYILVREAVSHFTTNFTVDELVIYDTYDIQYM